MVESTHWEYVHANFWLHKFSNFNLRNKNIENFVIFLISIFLHSKEIAPPYTSLDMAQHS